jgi:hypothetical protein
MKIDNVAELLLLAAGLGPGWVWISVAERRVARPDRSGVLEVAELVVIGALCTTLAALVVLTFAGAVGVVDRVELRNDAAGYVLDHPARTLPVLAALLVTSYAFAWIAARLACGGHQATQQPGTVWREVLGARKEDAAAVATVELRDGHRVQGVVATYTHTSPDQPRELALAAPMRVQHRGDAVPVDLPGDVLILHDEDILSINVTYVPIGSARSGSRGVPRLRRARGAVEPAAGAIAEADRRVA